MKHAAPSKLARLLQSPEMLVLIGTLLLCAVVAMVNPVFISAANLLDIFRNGIVTSMFAIAVLLVLIAGGIDVSFTAVAAFSLYSSVKLCLFIWPEAPYLAVAMCSTVIGGLLGLVNGLLVARYQLPTLIVTLGTLSIFRGALLTFVGTIYISDLPESVDRFARTALYQGQLQDGTLITLPATAAIFLAVAAAVWLLLTKSQLGRNLYALGGNETSAERLGINVMKLKLFVFMLAGGLAGLAGIVHATQIRLANPFDLVGTELNVLAAVVLGGARVSGGHGSVAGALIGVLLVTVINNSLVLMGIPSYWQKFVIGSLILLGAGLPMLLAQLGKQHQRRHAQPAS